MLFDSLGHATVDGNWLESDLDASFNSYSNQLKENQYIGGVVVGLSGKNAYQHVDFLNLSKNYSNLYPVAGFDPLIEPLSTIENLKKNGFYAIKIHPRFSNIDLSYNKKYLVDCFKVCADLDFPIFLCTFNQCKVESYQSIDPLYSLADILKESMNTKVLLVHGGVHDLMKYSDFARFNHNILIDLSLVIMKYAGSSLDLDIEFLFKHFDQKICIGSDYPEYSLSEVKGRFNEFAKDISVEKKENIASKNISRFLNLT